VGGVKDVKPCHMDWVRDVAWAPCIIPGVHMVASCSEDKTVILWTQSENGETKSHTKEWVPKLLHTFDAPVWRLSWSITGNILAVSSGENHVTLWKQMLDGSWTQVGQVEEPTRVTTAGGESSTTPEYSQ
jgi:protein transport protein SEC13